MGKRSKKTKYNFDQEMASSIVFMKGTWDSSKPKFGSDSFQYAEIYKYTDVGLRGRQYISTSEVKKILTNPPAGKLNGILRYLVPKKTFDNSIAQMVGDFREDYFEELKKSEGKVTFRNHYLLTLLVFNCIFCLVRVLGGKLFPIDKLMKMVSK